MIRIGISLPTFDPLRVGGTPKFVRAAQLAEQEGFGAVWVGDHLHMPAPVYEAVVAMSAVAASTTRMRLGFGVLLLGLRQPAWVAKQLATIDALAPGRLLLGVGVGGEFPEEFEAVGADVRRRGRLLDAALAELPGWLRGGSSPALEPQIGVMPPIWVGGRSDAALERAARVGDGWLSTWMSPERMREQGERLAELAAAHGRPRPRLGLAISVNVDANEGRAREEAEDYIQAMYGMPFEKVARYTPIGTAEHVAERLDAYVQAGVEEFVITLLAGDPVAQIPRLAQAGQLISRG